LADAGLRARLADLGQEIFPRDQQTPDVNAGRNPHFFGGMAFGG
jgi:hypothetical protein